MKRSEAVGDLAAYLLKMDRYLALNSVQAAQLAEYMLEWVGGGEAQLETVGAKSKTIRDYEDEVVLLRNILKAKDYYIDKLHDKLKALEKVEGV